MAKETEVSIIIVNYNTKTLTEQCILSVVEYTRDVQYEIIVVDNASNDESIPLLESLNKKGIINLIKSKKNLGFAGGNNLGIKKAKGKYLLLLNSDTMLNDNVIGNVYRWMEDNKDVGVATCALTGTDNVRQAPGGNLPNLLNVISWMTIEDLPFIDKIIKPFHPKKFEQKEPSELGWVTGTFFFIRKKVIDQIGVLDEDFFMYTEEVEFCYRAREKDWKMFYLPQHDIVHIGKASSNNKFALTQEIKGIKLFFRKHSPTWQYPILIMFLTLGSLLRVIAYSILGRKEQSEIYVDIFKNV